MHCLSVIRSVACRGAAVVLAAALLVVFGAASARADLCCLSNGSCSIYNVFTNPCVGGGETRIVGSTCAPTSCLGGCCQPSFGTCTLTGQNGCAGGNWLGFGSVCSTTFCPIGACCNALTGACALLGESACAGLYQGTGSTCQSSPCPPLGACCNAAGACVQGLQALCSQSDGGSWIAAACHPNPCPQPGICCDNTGGCSTALASVCGPTGTWTPSGTCSPNTCAQGVACCNSFGQCVMILPAQCTGQSLGAGSTCGPSSCMGACCILMSGGCNLTTAFSCGVQSGQSFRGIGVSCTPNPCQMGACCNLNDGSCGLQGPRCDQIPGAYQYQGDGTVCSSTLCPQPGACCLGAQCQFRTQASCLAGSTWVAASGCPAGAGGCIGACCNRWTGHCVVRTPTDCASSGLRFDGLNAACSAATCKACPADFDGVNGIAVSDIFNFLSAWFAGCP